jgi:hypothetical protein
MGVLVRLGLILGLMALFNRFAFFSPVAFGLAVVPALLLVLGYEMKLFAGPLGKELVLAPRSDEEKAAR